jgi:hypothetical protein
MPRPVYDAIYWTSDPSVAATKAPRGRVPLTLNIHLSSGHGAKAEHERKKRSGYKIAFRVKASQTVDFTFVEESTNATIPHVHDSAGAADLERLYGVAGEKWVAFRSEDTQQPKSRQPSFPGGDTGLVAQYRATLTIDPWSAPQAILCAHANGNESYAAHRILSLLDLQ